MEVTSDLRGPDLDVILHSPGGSPVAAEAIVCYLRSRFSDIRVFEPNFAKSASANKSAVIGVPHADFGEAVVAVVVREGGQDLSPEAIQSALRDRLANYKLPKAVEFVDELPRNTMGKVQKNALRDQYKDAFAET